MADDPKKMVRRFTGVFQPFLGGEPLPALDEQIAILAVSHCGGGNFSGNRHAVILLYITV
jgi:hypothetical protein